MYYHNTESAVDIIFFKGILDGSMRVLEKT